jgi:hypothetical protein
MRTLIVVAVVLLPGRAPAQQDVLGPGARVRVEAPQLFNGRTVGTIMSNTADSLVVAVPDRAEVVRYYSAPRSSFTQIEVSEGRSRAKGARRGGIVGLVLGLGLSAAIAANLQTDAGESAEIGLYIAFAAPGVMSFVGSSLGFLIRMERWTVVAP